MKLEDIYHELIQIEMEYDTLKKSGLKAGQDYKVKSVDVPDYDYSHSEEWQAAKKKSIKAYKELKKIEFKIRHKQI